MLRDYLDDLEVSCSSTRGEVLRNQMNVQKPLGSFGRIESIGYKISEVLGINRTSKIRGTICVFAADHGISELGLSIFPQSQTKKIVEMMEEGKTPINKIAACSHFPLYCLDVGIAGKVRSGRVVRDYKAMNGTKNLLIDDAMSEREVIQSIRTGMLFADELKAQGSDIVAVGEVGCGNTISSSIITAILCKKKADEITDVGTGISNEKLQKKIEIVGRKIDELKEYEGDLLTILKKVGGVEICAEAGFILGCARNGMVVIIDGFISGVSALIAYEINESIRKCIIPSHLSSEKGHKYIFEKLKLEPIIDWGMHYGIASGAAMILPVVISAYGITNE